MIWLFKLLTPKILKGIIKYVFEENELDIKYKELRHGQRDYEQKITDIGFKVEAMRTVLKDLDDNDERIVKLEEFEKQVRRKKAFKRKDE